MVVTMMLQVREGRVNCANGKRRGRDLEFGEEFIMLVDSTEQQVGRGIEDALKVCRPDSSWEHGSWHADLS